MLLKQSLILMRSYADSGNPPDFCRDLLNDVISISGADFGNVLLLNKEKTGFEIVAQRGVNLAFLKHFAFVPLEKEDSDCCDRAVKENWRVRIEDVEKDHAFRDHLEIARSVPFRAMQSVPLLGRNGNLLGVITTQFREPRLPNEEQLKELEHRIEQAGHLIEAMWAELTRTAGGQRSKTGENWFLHSLRFFQGLSEQDQDSLLQICSVKEHEKDENIILCGQKADRMFIVLNGWVKIYNVNNENRESGIMLLTQGDEFGTEAILNEEAYFYTASASTKTQILEFPASHLKDLIRRCPDIAEKIMRVFSDETRRRQINEICMRHKVATQRIACLLLRLTSWMKGNGGTFRMPYKKAVAATQLDMDQATFSRALADMKDWGVSTKEKSEVTINDFLKLSEHCCLHCPVPQGRCPGRRIRGDLEVYDSSL